MIQEILRVENLNVDFGEGKIIEDLSFSVKEKDVLAIIGPNGAGKTALFRALLGLISYQGSVKWEKGVKIGYVPQKFSVASDFPICVNEFLAIKENSKKKIQEILRLVGVSENIIGERLGILSGGQLQRILVAWAILGNSNVLLFDEPTSGIDIGGEETIYNLLHRLQAEKGLTVILISHDLNVVYKHAGEVLCLNRKKVCFGAPREILEPHHLTELYGGEASFYKHIH